jgi:hypothetical protein
MPRRKRGSKTIQGSKRQVAAKYGGRPRRHREPDNEPSARCAEIRGIRVSKINCSRRADLFPESINLS